jgi:Lon protease-like protein
MFPLSTVLFPHGYVPLHVFEPRYRALVADCLAGDRRFGVVLIARGSEVGGGDERLAVGTEAVIETAEPLPDGRWYMVARGLEPVRVVAWLADDPYPVAEVEAVAGATAGGPGDAVSGVGDAVHRAEASVRRVRALLSEMGESAALAADHSFGDTPDEIAWRLCALTPVNPLDRQRLLETASLVERLRLLVSLTDAAAVDLHRLLADG